MFYNDEDFEEPKTIFQVNDLILEHTSDESGKQASNSVRDWPSEEDHDSEGHPALSMGNEQSENNKDRDFVAYFDDGGSVYHVNGSPRERTPDESGPTSEPAHNWPPGNVQDSSNLHDGNEVELTRVASKKILHPSDAQSASESETYPEVRPQGVISNNSKN